MEENAINLKGILVILQERWKLILLSSLSFLFISSIVIFFLIKPQYETSTKLFIGKEQNNSKNYNFSDVDMYQKLLKTYGEVIKTEDLIKIAIKNKNLNLKSQEVLENLTVVSLADTQILEIRYRSKSPQESVELMKSLKEEFIKLSVELVPNGNVQTLEEPSFPMKVVSSNRNMRLLISIILGLILGVGITFFIEFLDNTYRNKEALEKAMDIPVLGVIPNLK